MAEKSEFCGMMSYGNFETLDSCLSSPLVTISGQSKPLIVIALRSSLFNMHPVLLNVQFHPCVDRKRNAVLCKSQTRNIGSVLVSYTSYLFSAPNLP